MKTYLKTAELAERWGLSQVTLRHWRRQGRGPAYLKVGKNVRYDLAEIQTYEQRNRDNGSD